jgi:hypothetical protein
MGANTGNGSVIANAMAAQGIDPNIIKNAQTYFGGGSWAGAANTLGLNDNSGNHSSLTQVGNQLWGTGVNGQRYLVKDFGNSGNLKNDWNSANLATRQSWNSPSPNAAAPTWNNTAPGGSAVNPYVPPVGSSTYAPQVTPTAAQNRGVFGGGIGQNQTAGANDGYLAPQPTTPQIRFNTNPFTKNPWGIQSRVRPQ